MLRAAEADWAKRFGHCGLPGSMILAQRHGLARFPAVRFSHVLTCNQPFMRIVTIGICDQGRLSMHACLQRSSLCGGWHTAIG